MVREPRVLALALVYSGTSAGLYALGFWAPLLIKQFGHSAHIVGWLNALPGVVAVVGMVLWARHSDKHAGAHVACGDSMPGGMCGVGVGGIRAGDGRQ